MEQKFIFTTAYAVFFLAFYLNALTEIILTITRTKLHLGLILFWIQVLQLIQNLSNKLTSFFYDITKKTYINKFN